jgi:hypothetical protein
LAVSHFFQMDEDGGQGLQAAAGPGGDGAVQVHAEERFGLLVDDARHDFLSAKLFGG